MSEVTAKIAEHPLSDFLYSHRNAKGVSNDVVISVEPGRAHINLRVQPEHRPLHAALTHTLGQALPAPGRVSRGNRTIYWLGPEEFLLVGSVEDSRALTHRLRQCVGEHHAAVTDLSGGQVILTVSGPATRALLSKASTLDLDAEVFTTSQCQQSTFAKATALYALRDEAPVFEVIVRRSFADYVARWLAHAGQEFGLVFAQSGP